MQVTTKSAHVVRDFESEESKGDESDRRDTANAANANSATATGTGRRRRRDAGGVASGSDGEKEKDSGEGKLNDDSEKRKEENGLIHYCMSLLNILLQRRPLYVSLVFSYPYYAELLASGLFFQPAPFQREQLSKAILAFVSRVEALQNSVAAINNLKRVRGFIIGILLGLMERVDEKSAKPAQYFETLQQVIRSTPLSAPPSASVSAPSTPTNSTTAAASAFWPNSASPPSAASSSSVDYSALCLKIYNRLLTHPITEVRATSTDAVLVGLLHLLSALIQQTPLVKSTLGKPAVQEIFDCLFQLPLSNPKAANSNANSAAATATAAYTTPSSSSMRPPKCKSNASRKAAFGLLCELVNGHLDNFRFLLDLLTPLHLQSHHGEFSSDWDFEAKDEEKSLSGYVGLRNLGASCFLNGTLQQLYMMTKLRSNILAIDVAEVEKEKTKDDSVLYQLQNIFAYLQESEKQCTDVSGLCKAMKDFEGNPINPTVQDDAAQFYTRLVDSIQEALKGTKHANACRAILAGVTTTQLIGRGSGCTHRKERDEEFLSITLEVKNKKNLHEALRAATEGEMLAGANAYKCELCKSKVDTLKRTLIKTLPHTLILTLKRFEMDYSTMQTNKINDRLDFPDRINLKPFTVDGVQEAENVSTANANANPNPAHTTSNSNSNTTTDGKSPENDAKSQSPVSGQFTASGGSGAVSDENYDYVLRGVVIHSGSVDRGHYYSFIQERISGDEEEKGVNGRWLHFNDSSVQPFDVRLLPEEAYGGIEERMSMAAQNYGEKIATEKYRNAYMLVYERVRPKLDEYKDKEKDKDPEQPNVDAHKKGADTQGANAANSNQAPTTLVLPSATKSTTTSITSEYVASPSPSPSPSPSLAAPNSNSTASADLPPRSPPKLVQQPSKCWISPKILESIWEQNLAYWRDSMVFSQNYFDFLWRLLHDLPAQAQWTPLTTNTLAEKFKANTVQQEIQTTASATAAVSLTLPEANDVVAAIIQLGTRFVLQTLSRAHWKSSLPQWGDYLRSLYSCSPSSSVWLLNEFANPRTGWMGDFLLSCPLPDVRKSVALMLSEVLVKVSKLEEPLLEAAVVSAPARLERKPSSDPTLSRPAAVHSTMIHGDGLEDDYSIIDKDEANDLVGATQNRSGSGNVSKHMDSPSFTVRFVDFLLCLLKTSANNWRRFSQYFLVIGQFGLAGEKQVAYLLNAHNLLAKLIDFFVGDSSPLPIADMVLDAKGKRVQMGDSVYGPDWTSFIDLLRILILSSQSQSKQKTPFLLPAVSTEGGIPLSEAAHQLFFSKIFLGNLLSAAVSRKRGKSIGAILSHHAHENAEFSKLILSMTCNAIKERNVDEIRPYFRILMALAALEDSLTQQRIDWLLATLTTTMHSQRLYWRITDVCLEHFIRLAKKNEKIRQWIPTHRDNVDWMIKWISAYPLPPKPGDGIQLNKPFVKHSTLNPTLSAPASPPFIGPVAAATATAATRVLYVASEGLSAAQKRECLELLRAGKSLSLDDATDSDEDLSDRTFTVGDTVDCLDTIKKWLPGKVIDIADNGRRIKIHYEGYTERWDEWLSSDSERIAKFGKYTTVKGSKGQKSSGIGRMM